MVKIIVSMGFFICLCLFNIQIMVIGYRQNITALLYFGLSIPFFIYILIKCMKLLNTITIEKEHLIVKNAFFGKKIIKYKDITYWKETSGYTTGLFHRSLILKLNKTTIAILEDVDFKKYENLRAILTANWDAKMKI